MTWYTVVSVHYITLLRQIFVTLYHIIFITRSIALQVPLATATKLRACILEDSRSTTLRLGMLYCYCIVSRYCVSYNNPLSFHIHHTFLCNSFCLASSSRHSHQTACMYSGRQQEHNTKTWYVVLPLYYITLLCQIIITLYLFI